MAGSITFGSTDSRYMKLRAVVSALATLANDSADVTPVATDDFPRLEERFWEGVGEFADRVNEEFGGFTPLGTAAYKDIPASGNASASQVVYGTDTRLSDARPPSAHTHTTAAITDLTVVGSALATAVDAASARSTLGLGTLATQNGTFSGTSSGTNTGDQTITLTGDVTGSGTGSFATTLANVVTGATKGSTAAKTVSITYNNKGLVTAASEQDIAIAGTQITSGDIAVARIATALTTPGPIGSTTPSTGAFTTLSATGQITSTLATGTAPFSVASTTVVANLNVSALNGKTFDAPGPIGGTTAAAGTFTTLTASTLGLTGAATITLNALGTTPSAAVTVVNTTAAAAGAQQITPAIHWLSQGWKTDSGGASQTVEWRAVSLPVQGAANPSGQWFLQTSINGGAYTSPMTVTSAGVVTTLSSVVCGGNVTGGAISATQSVTAGAAFSFLWAGRGILTSQAAGQIQLGNADAAAPVQQTLSVQSVVAGTSNTAGVNFTIKGSAGTGTGAGGSIIFQVAPAGSTGSSQNAYSTALTLSNTSLLATFGGAITAGGSIQTPSTSAFYWGSRSVVRSPSDSVITLANSAETSFDRLQFGGTTSSFGAIARNGAGIKIVLASSSSTLSDLTCSTLATQGYTVATLPAAGTAGRRAHVTDALAPAFLAAVVGGGAVICPVFDNGSAWVVG